jgi:hypothetical protein
VVFGERNPARRRAAIEELYTDDCVLCVPDDVLVDDGALDNFAGYLRATHPHFVYTQHGEPQALHNGGFLAWASALKALLPSTPGSISSLSETAR